jgi:hypothetical protein
MTQAEIVAIDLGLRCGFAAFDVDGNLLTYRSTNFGSRGRLRKAAWGVLNDYAEVSELVTEGDRNLSNIWRSVAEKRGIEVVEVAPETWRKSLLDARFRRTGSDAKQAAGELAREYIEYCSLPRPTSLRHDAAEAVCIGLWRAVGRELPVALRFVDM